MKKTMRATSLRGVLSTLLVLMILGAGAGFYYGLQQIRDFSVEVSHTAADANASSDAIGELQKLKQALAERETLVAKANQLFSTDNDYQTQALKDVQRYAAAIGLTISSTDFEVAEENDGMASIVNIGKPFKIVLQSPLSYAKLLQLLDAIEGNLPKMQVSSITISRPETNNSDLVVTGEVQIVISTR